MFIIGKLIQTAVNSRSMDSAVFNYLVLCITSFRSNVVKKYSDHTLYAVSCQSKSSNIVIKKTYIILKTFSCKQY